MPHLRSSSEGVRDERIGVFVHRPQISEGHATQAAQEPFPQTLNRQVAVRSDVFWDWDLTLLALSIIVSSAPLGAE